MNRGKESSIFFRFSVVYNFSNSLNQSTVLIVCINFNRKFRYSRNSQTSVECHPSEIRQLTTVIEKQRDALKSHVRLLCSFFCIAYFCNPHLSITNSKLDDFSERFISAMYSRNNGEKVEGDHVRLHCTRTLPTHPSPPHSRSLPFAASSHIFWQKTQIGFTL